MYYETEYRKIETKLVIGYILRNNWQAHIVVKDLLHIRFQCEVQQNSCAYRYFFTQLK